MYSDAVSRRKNLDIFNYKLYYLIEYFRELYYYHTFNVFYTRHYNIGIRY